MNLDGYIGLHNDGGWEWYCVAESNIFQQKWKRHLSKAFFHESCSFSSNYEHVTGKRAQAWPILEAHSISDIS
jgi:hypothetical protein